MQPESGEVGDQSSSYRIKIEPIESQRPTGEQPKYKIIDDPDSPTKQVSRETSFKKLKLTENMDWRTREGILKRATRVDEDFDNTGQADQEENEQGSSLAT